MDDGMSLTAVVRSLSHGFGSLSRTKASRASGYHISIVGLVGIVGLMIYAIKDGKLELFTVLPWPSGRADRLENLSLVPGLQNLGNNCFLNVILQALASCFCFQSFLQNVIRESEVENLEEGMPLTVALATLCEDLCFVGREYVVLSPRRVMLAMIHRIPKFNLTSQQDAAEAFLHLLCSMREEFEDSYSSNPTSLADILASSHRILNLRPRDWQSPWERWQQVFVGPFDGVLASILTCQSCSSQISMSFESFDSLPLSPVLCNGAAIGVGCTLVDCLKQFIVSEHVENYHCSHCWHIAAIKYLSLMEANEADIEKLRRCGEQDACECQNLCHLQKIPWSKKFSHVLKQLSIARCPKILCIQLKRVHVNPFRELVKLQGHVTFPLILDMSPFMTTRVGAKMWEEKGQRVQVKLKCQNTTPVSPYCNAQVDTVLLNGIDEPTREKINSEDLVGDEYGSSVKAQELLGETIYPCIGYPSKSMHMERIANKVDMSRDLVPKETHIYQLVSVVEHFGRAGGGHYTVYRCARAESCERVSNDQFNSTPWHWFCISDSDVQVVLETDVLAAEASMLFYEKIAVDRKCKSHFSSQNCHCGCLA